MIFRLLSKCTRKTEQSRKFKIIYINYSLKGKLIYVPSHIGIDGYEVPDTEAIAAIYAILTNINIRLEDIQNQIKSKTRFKCHDK